MSEIGNKYREIERTRMKKMKELMKEYDENVYYPAIKELRRLCGETERGHNFNFIDTNPIGYPIFTCSICGLTEIRREEP